MGAADAGRSPRRRADRAGPRLRDWLRPLSTATAALLLLSFASISLPAAVVQPVTLDVEPTVTDPQPPPGSVVPAGATVLAATVSDTAGAPWWFTVDDETVLGAAVDPDGSLSALRGVEATLTPGPHRIAVGVAGHGVVRSWDIEVSGLSVDVADDADAQVAARLQPGVRDGPAVLVPVDARPGVGVAVPALVQRLDAVVVPFSGDQLSPDDVRRITAAGGPPILLGPTTSIPAGVADQLVEMGLAPTRLSALTPAGMSVALAEQSILRAGAARALVVGPASPPEIALATAASAAALDADVVLVEDTGNLSAAAAAVVATHRVVMLSTALSPAAKTAVEAALDPTAVASDAVVGAIAATEAIVLSDVLTLGRAVVAAATSTPDRPALVGSDVALGWVAANRPSRVTVIAPVAPAAQPSLEVELPELATTLALDVSAPAVERLRPSGAPVLGDLDALADELRRTWVDGPAAPRVEALVDDGSRLVVTVTADRAITDAEITVSLLGYEWPGTVDVVGQQVVWRGEDRPLLPLPLEPEQDDAPLPVEITTTVTGQGGAGTPVTRHQRFDAVAGVATGDTVSPEGWIVAGGSDQRVGDSGRLYTYSVEVEPLTGLDVDEVAAEVSEILSDPRSWTADGAVSFRRVGTSAQATLRVVVAQPATVDDFCGRVGLRTGGRVSCWDGYRSMLNLDRWNTGVVPFHADIEVYRRYLVNHEVGHGLAHGHEFCGGAGQVAPVMQQQTGGLQGCLANGWPFP